MNGNEPSPYGLFLDDADMKFLNDALAHYAANTGQMAQVQEWFNRAISQPRQDAFLKANPLYDPDGLTDDLEGNGKDA